MNMRVGVTLSLFSHCLTKLFILVLYSVAYHLGFFHVLMPLLNLNATFDREHYELMSNMQHLFAFSVSIVTHALNH
jgi:hypothetical protein